MKRWSLVAGIAPLCLSPVVLAQDAALRTSVDYLQPVAERPVAVEEDERFVRLGGWKLTPQAELSGTFDSNIYATAKDEEDDFITVLKPKARLQSDWNVHEVMLEAGADLGWYQDFSSEDYQDFYLVNRNRLDIVYGTRLLTDVLYRDAHVARSSPDSDGLTAEPLTYELLRGMIGFERDLGILGLRADIQAEDINYDDSDRVGGGTIDNSYRDRTVVDGGLRLSYSRFEGAEAYLSARLREVSYEDSTLGGRPDRDSSGYDIGLGLRKSVSDLWVFDAFVGYSPRHFADRALDDISGGDALAFSVKALWNPTPITSLIADFQRKTFETTTVGSSALISTAFNLRLEHKLTEALLLDANLGYSINDYAGVSREDDLYRASLGVAYHLTQLASVRAEYSYRERDSTAALNDYDRQLLQLQLLVNY
ncbi:outer membrane beta-barrel protein [Marichromatium bheemlicum]|uniref:Outer membrane beta-barrel protein n=1 Tax=Marichromatium bheemlicum TaxID=365339 RepID=A0ABX1IC02_9GAMM|nr:outer membrane beta-barrel protein [Marichromatium bheemlicum]NKN34549.1 outer membrane beta-barrel protein [Marichromatium bheemlicum]